MSAIARAPLALHCRSGRTTRTRVAPVCAASAAPSTSRRAAVLLGAGLLAAALPGAARAKDLLAAEAAKEARRAALRAAAEESQRTGVGSQVFEEPEFSVGDDKSPNTHSRQDEGLRQQTNI